MNAAHLEIQGVNILQTESNAYHMEINSTIKTDGSIKANIDAFEGEMYLEDYEPHTAFASLLFPKTNANKHQVVNVSQEIKITDMTAFTRFNVWFHNNETVRITINGRTKVKPHGLNRKYGVTFKKTLIINGLNNFNGTEVTDGHISLENDDNGRNFNGTANIPNNSVFTHPFREMFLSPTSLATKTLVPCISKICSSSLATTSSTSRRPWISLRSSLLFARSHTVTQVSSHLSC